MREHGENTVRVEGTVVHNYPSASFNYPGIERNMNSVLEAAAPLERWVYYVHPDPELGLTPEAVKTLKRRYEEFASHGCIGIALHITTGLHTSITKTVTSGLTIPVLYSKSSEELDAFVEDLLK